MPQTVVDLIGKPIGMYDSNLPGHVSLKILHAVDITDVCNGDLKWRKVLKFTQAVRGPIVEITDCYLSPVNTGTSVHYHVNEIDLADTETFSNFPRFAEKFDITPDKLLALIREHMAGMPIA